MKIPYFRFLCCFRLFVPRMRGDKDSTHSPHTTYVDFVVIRFIQRIVFRAMRAILEPSNITIFTVSPTHSNNQMWFR